LHPRSGAPENRLDNGFALARENPERRVSTITRPATRSLMPTTDQHPTNVTKTTKTRTWARSVGLGMITGAADDDPSAVGTYASVGARLGPAFLWIAPAVFPMMFAVVYLSAKLGQVTGQGLFEAIRHRFPRWVLYLALIGVLIGNTVEAAADLGGMAAAINLLIPIPVPWIVLGSGLVLLALQIWGSYTLIKSIFRWLALALLAYAGAAILARPDLGPVLRGTFVPTLRFDKQFLELIVAVIGTSLSAYIYTWQSNEEVEEEIAMGRTKLSQRRGATEEELRQSRRDVFFGMFFSNLVMYFIMLSTGAALFAAGKHDLTSAADAAEALRPLAGSAASLLFAIGVGAVGFLAVPVMTTGAAYDLAQTLGWRHSLHAKPHEAKGFYGAMALITAVGIGLNFLGFNPMRALVIAGVVQGFSAPPLLVLIMLMTGDRRLMGARANGLGMKALGWTTTAITFLATGTLVASWLR
jgi:NRAMP (natural resistance-associated macrophage protein)-like metal ion transporter